MKKIGREVSRVFKKKSRRPPSPPPPPPPPPPREPSPSPPPPPPPPEPYRRPTHPFLFPQTQSTVLPDPTLFFSPYLLSSPLSNNSFFQNFVLKMIFNPDLTISTSNNPNPYATHIVSSFSDRSVTLDLPSSNLRFFLVRGSPYLTCVATNGVSLSISTVHAILQISPNSSLTKYTIKLNNNQTWLLYASSPINLSLGISSIISIGFSGIIRIAIVPNSDPRYESILDQFSHCYPACGDALFSNPFSLGYKWDKRGYGDLLMLAHPLHLQLLSSSDCKITVLDDFEYKSIDGDPVGVVGDSWVLKSDPVSVTWHSIGGVNEESYPEIVVTLIKDIEALNAATTSTTSSTNGFLYDEKWGGILTKQGSLDSGADFGFGIYNDHHYHLGLLLYAIAVLAKIDPTWERNYRPQAYSRANQESTSEAVNAYYSAALMGLAYGDTHLVATASTIAAMENHSAQTLWHVREGGTMYVEEFTRENRVVGVLWANKRDSGLWFAPVEWRECRVGIQLLPLLPITEVLFCESGFVRDLVAWTSAALGREGVLEGWKGFLHALEGVYDKESALGKIRNLNGFDDGNSLTNLL
ncbi:hypothetical protein TEA_003526 [Camellia sinensis var. sinensis]|uniref:glucan endo-1,3-beta-D-glucosidase n=1 Tax=Camellia sinensis var. sinensis TaxID=542762 RepID=A0A4V3WM81_CAMSN|nr:hypothetical protein TEA_003526 [Camellia sinensis var. sinensis]